MAKTYVLDTNVLLHNPQSIFSFLDNHVVIPLAVIEEIDNQKKRQDEIGRNARIVSRHLDGLRSKGRLSEGIPLPQGTDFFPQEFAILKNDLNPSLSALVRCRQGHIRRLYKEDQAS